MVILVASCSVLAAVVCGGGIFAAASEAWHTSSGHCDHASGADQVHQTPLYKSTRRLRRTFNRRKAFLNNMITSSPSGVVLTSRFSFVLVFHAVSGTRILAHSGSSPALSLLPIALPAKSTPVDFLPPSLG